MYFLISGIFILFCFIFYGRNKQKYKQKIDRNTNILITGGCMGLGFELCLIFAKKHQCNLIILDINENLSENLGCLNKKNKII